MMSSRLPCSHSRCASSSRGSPASPGAAAAFADGAALGALATLDARRRRERRAGALGALADGGADGVHEPHAKRRSATVRAKRALDMAPMVDDGRPREARHDGPADHHGPLVVVTRP